MIRDRGYIILRDDAPAHPDYYTLKLIRVWYDLDGNITSYDINPYVTQDSTLGIITEVALMAEALNKPIMSKILLDSKIIKYRLRNLNAK